MRWLLVATFLTCACPHLAAAKCEAELRNIEEPDMEFILERLPRLQSARRVKADVDELIPLLEWYSKYSLYKHRQWIQDKKEDRENLNSRHHFFEKLKDRKDGREYAKGLIKRDQLLAFRQKKKPLSLTVQEITFEKDIKALIARDSEAALSQSWSDKREIIRRILILLQSTAVWREEMFGFSGWINPLVADTNELLDRLAGLNVEPRYRRIRTESNDDDEDENSRPDPYSYDLDTISYLTTYNDYTRLFAHLNLQPGHTFVEIGAGFARASLVLGILYPEVHYLGYDVVPERLREASRMINRMKLQNAEVEEANVLDSTFKLASADFYYLYNPLEFNPLPALKSQLQKVAKRRNPLLILISERNQYTDQRSWLNRVRLPYGLKMIRPAELYKIKTR